MLKQLAKDTVIYGIGDFVSRVIGFFVFPIYANLFTVEKFGILELASTFGALAMIFMELGINNSIQRFYFDTDTKEERRSFLVSSGLYLLLFWSIFIFGVVVVFLYFMQNILQLHFSLGFSLLFVSILVNIPRLLFQYSLNTLRLHFAPVKFTILSGLQNIGGALLGLVLIIYLSFDIEGFFWGPLIMTMMVLPIAIYTIKKDIVWKIDKNDVKRIVKFGYPFIFAGLAYWLFASMDRWLLSTLSNNQEVGWYSMGFKFSTLLYFVMGAFSRAWSPYAIKLYAENPNYKQIIARLFTLWFLFLVFLGMFLSFFGLEILFLITPEAYWEAANSLILIVFGVVYYGTTQFTVIGISISKRTGILSRVAWIIAGINLGLNYCLIPRFGASGAAFATLISYAVLTSLYLYYTQKLHPIPIEKMKLFYCNIILVVALLFSIYMNTLTWNVNILLFKVVFIIILIIVSFTLKIVDFNEVKYHIVNLKKQII